MRLVSSGCRTVFPLGWVGTSCAWGAYVTRRDDYAQYSVSQANSYCSDTLLSTPHVASFGSDSPVAATFARPLRAFRRWLLRPLRPDFLDIKPSGLATGPRRRPSSLLVSLRCPIGHSVDIANENWTSGMRTDSCRFLLSVADGDASTWVFAEFSSKWRTAFSHLRGRSYNRTVVHDSSIRNRHS
jgi:hypothetical protein